MPNVRPQPGQNLEHPILLLVYVLFSPFRSSYSVILQFGRSTTDGIIDRLFDLTPLTTFKKPPLITFKRPSLNTMEYIGDEVDKLELRTILNKSYNTMGEKVSVSYDPESLAWASRVPRSIFGAVSDAVKNTLDKEGSEAISEHFGPVGLPAELSERNSFIGKLKVRTGGNSYRVIVDFSKNQNQANIVSIRPLN